MKKENGSDGKLDEIVKLLENIIILQAIRDGIKGQSIRKFLGVDMNRVTKISKMVKAAKK